MGGRVGRRGGKAQSSRLDTQLPTLNLQVKHVPATVILSVGLAAAAGGAEPDIRFTRATSLPQVGLRVRLMPDAREAPLPAPKVYTFELIGTGGRRREWRQF